MLNNGISGGYLNVAVKGPFDDAEEWASNAQGSLNYRGQLDNGPWAAGLSACFDNGCASSFLVGRIGISLIVNPGPRGESDRQLSAGLAQLARATAAKFDNVDLLDAALPSETRSCYFSPFEPLGSGNCETEPVTESEQKDESSPPEALEEQGENAGQPPEESAPTPTAIVFAGPYKIAGSPEFGTPADMTVSELKFGSKDYGNLTLEGTVRNGASCVNDVGVIVKVLDGSGTVLAEAGSSFTLQPGDTTFVEWEFLGTSPGTIPAQTRDFQFVAEGMNGSC